MRHKLRTPRSEPEPTSRVALWISLFLFMVLLIFIMVVFFTRPVLTPDQRNLLRLLSALLAGFAVALLGGDVSLRSQWLAPFRVTISATGGIAVFIFMYLITPNLFGPERASAAEVRQCMAQHNLKQAHQTVPQDVPTPSPDNSTQVFSAEIISSCDWPPPTFAGADGYSQVVVTTVEGPGSDEASDTNAADRIVSSCGRLRLIYQHGSQGAYSFNHAITVESGSVVTTDGHEWTSDPANTLPFYPDLHETVVLHNFKYGLQEATCVA